MKTCDDYPELEHCDSCHEDWEELGIEMCTSAVTLEGEDTHVCCKVAVYLNDLYLNDISK